MRLSLIPRDRNHFPQACCADFSCEHRPTQGKTQHNLSFPSSFSSCPTTKTTTMILFSFSAPEPKQMEKERLIASGGGSRGTLGRLQPTTNGSFISAPVCRMLMCVCVFLSARYSVRVCRRKKEIEREKKRWNYDPFFLSSFPSIIVSSWFPHPLSFWLDDITSSSYHQEGERSQQTFPKGDFNCNCSVNSIRLLGTAGARSRKKKKKLNRNQGGIKGEN